MLIPSSSSTSKQSDHPIYQSMAMRQGDSPRNMLTPPPSSSLGNHIVAVDTEVPVDVHQSGDNHRTMLISSSSDNSEQGDCPILGSMTRRQGDSPRNMLTSPSPSPSIGVHIFAVDTEVPVDVDPLNVAIIVTISETNGHIRQYGPSFSGNEVAEIIAILQSNIPKRMASRCATWFVLDLLRITGSTSIPTNLEEVQENIEDLQLYMLHRDDEKNRQLSMDIARYHGLGRSAYADHCEIGRRSISILATMDIIRPYISVLCILRLRWLELQNEYIVVRKYTLTVVDPKSEKQEDADVDPK